MHYFAAAREAAGRESEPLDLAAGTTIAELGSTLFRRHPKLDGIGLRYAVGERFVPETTSLADGDRVALLPPVSGG